MSNFAIDKSQNFINEWLKSGAEVTLIARPHDFGKTFILGKVEEYFRLGTFSEQGIFPVISISFSNVTGKDYSEAKQKMCEAIIDSYQKNTYLLSSDIFHSDVEKRYFSSILLKPVHNDISSALTRLSECLYRYYNKKVIILIDDCDTPMRDAYLGGYWNEMEHFMRNFLLSTFKTNNWIERGLIMSTTCLSKTLISDLNFSIATLTSERYSTVFGYTYEEAKSIFNWIGLTPDEKDMAEISELYGQYNIGSTKNIYNKNIIKINSQVHPNYYLNYSPEKSVISRVLREANHYVKEGLEELLKGKTIYATIDEYVSYDELNPDNTTSVWSFMFVCGYLKIVSATQMSDKYEVALTNSGVVQMLEGIIRGWFAKSSDSNERFVDVLLSDDIEEANKCLNSILSEYNDFGGEPERFYHALVLLLTVILRGKYEVITNNGNGFKKYNVILEPAEHDKEKIIMELREYNPEKEASLSSSARTALEHLREIPNVHDMVDVPTEDIKYYGIAFGKGEALIVR